MAELLIDSGADINKSDETGMFPLLLSSENGYAEVTRVLVSHGANLSQFCSGETACGHFPLVGAV